MKNFNDITYIKDYLDGKLSDSDLKEFEAQLAVDESLKKELKQYATLFSGFKYLGEESFEEDVKKWGTELKNQDNTKVISNKKRSISPLYRQMALAASVLIIIAFGMNFWANQNYSNEVLSDNFYSAPITSGTMGSNDQLLKPLNELFEKAHKYYQDGEYAKSLDAFKYISNVLANNQTQMDQLSYKFYFENTEWTKVILWLKMGRTDTPTFKQTLDFIANNPNHAYSKNAQELKSKLNGFWRGLI
jgi:hypothetical protein